MSEGLQLTPPHELTVSQQLTLSDIEHQLSEQGQFCLLDWLIAHNILPYAIYEDWRYGNSEALLDGPLLSAEQLTQWCSATERHCKKLKLQPELQTLFCWGEQQRPLTISRDKNLHNAVAQTWMRQQDIPQLDLFMDNSATIAENQVRQALSGRQFEQAGATLQRLTQLNAKHAKLGNYQDLINYGLHLITSPSIPEDQLQEELAGLEQEVQPLALEVLGRSARDYLAIAWRRLGDSGNHTTFDATKPELHASYAYSRIPDWQAVNDSLRRCTALYDTPLLLERYAQALENQQQRAHSLYVWCLLFETDSAYASTAAESGAHSEIRNLWDQFWDISEDMHNEDESLWVKFFPCYVLFNHAGLVHLSEQFRGFRDTTLSTTAALLSNKFKLKNTATQANDHQQNTKNEMKLRETLQAIHPGLLKLYIASAVH